MKQKIKIMEHKPELSDDEIRSYMDFDRLLASRKMLNNTSKLHVLKWLVPIIVITGISAWFVFVNLRNEKEAESSIPKSSPREATIQPSLQPSAPLEQKHVQPQSDVQKTPEPSSNKPVVNETKKIADNQDDNKSVEDIYIQAEPVDGYSSLYTYFNSQLVYPAEAIQDSIQGVETISFVINSEGKPEKIEVKQSLGPAFEKEARRLIENMPMWKAATLNGKAVPSQMSLPLTFQIQTVNVNK